MRTIFTFCIAAGLLLGWNAAAQNLPAPRRTHWENPGSRTTFAPQKTVLLSQFGADPTGAQPADSALAKALLSLNGPGKILLDKGTFLFARTITLPDSLILEGTNDAATPGPDTKLLLRSGLHNHGISVVGALTGAVADALPPTAGDTFLMASGSSFSAGDYLLLRPFDDSALVNNSWALGTTGQVLRVKASSGNKIFTDKPIRRSYRLGSPLQLVKLAPRRQVHLKCLAIERMDSTTDQTSNIYFENAVDCSVSGISSRKCNYAHIDVHTSKNITVEASGFREGFSYGDGGKAYGVMLQATSSDCYVHLNHFEHLRHSLILQSGANGNVLAYNHSADPFWASGTLPADAAGDVVLHGNYVYQNLMEGNAVQNVVIDNSHGTNGPFNTFFRNQIANWGLFMNTAPASDSQNFIGNLITSTTLFRGLYSLQGSGHFEGGNKVKTTVQPAGAGEWPEASLFSYAPRTFYQTLSSFPPFTLAGTGRAQEAQYRAEVLGHTAACGEITYPAGVSDAVLEKGRSLHCYPNPTAGKLQIAGSFSKGAVILLTDLWGRKCLSQVATGATETLDLTPLPAGLYFIRAGGETRKIVKE